MTFLTNATLFALLSNPTLSIALVSRSCNETQDEVYNRKKSRSNRKLQKL